MIVGGFALRITSIYLTKMSINMYLHFVGEVKPEKGLLETNNNVYIFNNYGTGDIF